MTLLRLGWGGFQWHPSQMPVPRLRVWPNDDAVLLFVGVGDRWSDPVVGVDLYVRGRLGDWWSGWLWERGRKKQEARRAS